jgi:serine/threonine-protein kinase
VENETLTSSLPPPVRAVPRLAGKRRFGRYQLLYRFAAGGMAQLYLARLTGVEGFEKLVAIKMIHQHLAEHPEFVKMFIDEARLASRIAHTSVAHIIELGRQGKTLYIAMEYVEGESLGALLRKLLPPFRITARIAADVAAGLHAAHELRDGQGELLGVVHRDVSPQNVLISYKGATKVVDFGVARARGRLHTTQGELKGKISYMAPEQLTEDRKIDRRTDIFALGIVMFEATTRRRLFKAESPEAQIAKVLSYEIPPPSKIVSGYPAELERIVLKALERDPNRRYQTAQELQKALERYLAGSGEPVLQADVGELMTALFTDRMTEKRELLSRAEAAPEEESSVPEVELVSDASIAFGSIGSLLRRRSDRTLWFRLGGLGVFVVVLGVFGYLLMAGPDTRKTSAPAPDVSTGAATASSPDQRRPPPTPDAAPRQVTISARATPRRAKLTLDGKAVANPLELHQPVRSGTATLEATAPGYESQSFEVPLDRGGSFVIALRRLRRGSRRTSSPKKPPTKKKGGLGDDDVVNPYD